MLAKVLCCALLLLQAAAAPQSSVRRWNDIELAPLAKSLDAYFEARSLGLGIENAKSEVTKALDALRRASAGQDPLRKPADMQRARALARDLSKVKVEKGKVTQDLFTDCNLEGKGLAFAYWVPKEYDPAQKVYPLIFAIPDENETPAEHLRSNWMLREIQDGAILVAVQMPKSQGEWGKVSVNGRPGGLSYVMTGLRMATERFALDFDRIYVAGRGKGVSAALAAGNYSPQRFAGVLGRAGDASELGPENFSNLPTLLIGGGARASAFLDSVRKAGFDNCTLERSGGEKEMWDWMSKQARTAYPKSATVVPGDPFPTRAYWLRVAPSALKPRATATIDRDENKVSIRAEGVSSVTLYLNDALLDLDKPLLIECNGTERSVRVNRSVQEVLDLMLEGMSEPGAFYVAQTSVPTNAEATIATPRIAAAPDPEFESALLATRDDVEKLWQLFLWCKSTQREVLGLRVLPRIVRRDPNHELARAALGHKFSKGHWFTTQAAFERFESSQDPVRAAQLGQIEFKSLWMHPEERALVGKGWVKEQETGLWITPADRKRLAEGWTRQGLEWISPIETAAMDVGLWKVDGEWIDLDTANQRRSRIDAMWRIPDADVLLSSTTDMATGQAALLQMRRAIADLRKVFGAQPLLPLAVAMLRDEAQYDQFAFGEHDGRRRATHAGRLHTIHSAFFAESWFLRNEGKLEFAGQGVCYWDALQDGGNLYGVHAARLALGLSYVAALDPSPKAVQKALASGPQGGYFAAYESEKSLPAWLRWGAAVYGERFFQDELVAEGADPWWARKWSLENLARLGGLAPLSEILACKLDPDAREASLRLLIEAGLVVSFIVDGDCAPVRAAHAEFKAALVSGSLHVKYVKALTDALIAHEQELRAYSKL